MYNLPEHVPGRAVAVGVLFLLLVACDCLWRLRDSQLHSPQLTSISSAAEDVGIGAALEGASMANKTVVITILNKAYAEKGGMLDLFLWSLRHGEGTEFLINHLLLVAVDEAAFSRCRELQLHCYRFVAECAKCSSAEALYMSNGFLSMMWSRTLLLANVLKHGYNFIFTDMDVMWLRNPFPNLRHYGDRDLQISCDRYNGGAGDESNPMNTGFYFVASNKRTIALFDEWYAARNKFEGMKEQDVLHRMKKGGAFKRLGLKVRFLDTAYYSGFCEVSRDAAKVTTVHANCCRSIKAKHADLDAVVKFWKDYSKGRASNATWPPHHEACSRSWKAN